MDAVDRMMAQWRDELPEVATPALELVKRIGRLSGLIDETVNAVLADYDLTYAEFDVLMTLRRSGPPFRLKPTELTRAAMLSSGGTSNIKRRLSAKGLTDSAADPEDGRSSWLFLTPQGLKVATETAIAVTAAVDTLFADFPADATAALTSLLRQAQTGSVLGQ